MPVSHKCYEVMEVEGPEGGGAPLVGEADWQEPLLHDVQSAEKAVRIAAPYASVKVASLLLPVIRDAVGRGVPVRIAEDKPAAVASRERLASVVAILREAGREASVVGVVVAGRRTLPRAYRRCMGGCRRHGSPHAGRTPHVRPGVAHLPRISGVLLGLPRTLDLSIRWTDRIQSQSGDWSGNVFDFFTRVSARLVRWLKVPFRLEGMVRQDETPAHKAVREALANCLVNADYRQSQSVVVEQWPDRLVLANPGTIICGREQMLRGGLSQPRNAGLFKMFNLIGIGEHAGSEVPDILAAWDEAGSKHRRHGNRQMQHVVLVYPWHGRARPGLLPSGGHVSCDGVQVDMFFFDLSNAGKAWGRCWGWWRSWWDSRMVNLT